MSWKLSYILIAAAIASGAPALAAVSQNAGKSRVSERVQHELSARYPGARVEVADSVRWNGGMDPEGLDLSSIRVLAVNPQGFAQISANSASGQSIEGWVHYSALMPTYVAVRRVMPGEKLMPDMFVQQEVSISSGPAYDYRGVILSNAQPIEGLQSRQTVLEGQFLTTSAVERVPDLRRGDQVTLTVISGALTVSTQAMAQEPAFVHGRVRVISQKTKREFVGELKEDGSVEVKL